MAGKRRWRGELAEWAKGASAGTELATAHASSFIISRPPRPSRAIRCWWPAAARHGHKQRSRDYSRPAARERPWSGHPAREWPRWRFALRSGRGRRRSSKLPDSRPPQRRPRPGRQWPWQLRDGGGQSRDQRRIAQLARELAKLQAIAAGVGGVSGQSHAPSSGRPRRLVIVHCAARRSTRARCTSASAASFAARANNMAVAKVSSPWPIATRWIIAPRVSNCSTCSRQGLRVGRGQLALPVCGKSLLPAIGRHGGQVVAQGDRHVLRVAGLWLPAQGQGQLASLIGRCHPLQCGK